MRSVLALMRSAYLTATSYRLAMVLSVGGLLAAFVPVYFVAHALQDTVAASIDAQGGDYFGFLIVGMAATYLFSAATSALPGALSGAIGTGMLEALLVTRTSLPSIVIGLAGYGLVWSGLRALLMIAGAVIVGVEFGWAGALPAAGVAALMVVAYFALGMLASALVLVFRTSGPLVPAILMGTGLLGGVYYATTSIPGWLENLSVLVPATYALRAMRMLVFADASLADVASDVMILGGYTAVLVAFAMLAFTWALRYARSAGTLSQY